MLGGVVLGPVLLSTACMNDMCAVVQVQSDQAATSRLAQANAGVMPSGTADVQKAALLTQLSQLCHLQAGAIAWPPHTL